MQGIRFYAFNPLAGGLLTSGRYLENGDDIASAIPETGRFGTSSQSGSMYRDRYWKSSFFAALAQVDTVCRVFNITIQDAALRWLAHHSALRNKRGDGVVLGASSVTHLKDNLDSYMKNGPLPIPVLVAFEKAWTLCRGDCPKYFRP